MPIFHKGFWNSSRAWFPRRNPRRTPLERVGGINPNYTLYRNKEGGTIANFLKRVWEQFWGLDSPEDPPEDPLENSPGGSPGGPPRRIPERVRGINPNYVLYQNNEGGTPEDPREGRGSARAC